MAQFSGEMYHYMAWGGRLGGALYLLTAMKAVSLSVLETSTYLSREVRSLMRQVILRTKLLYRLLNSVSPRALNQNTHEALAHHRSV